MSFCDKCSCGAVDSVVEEDYRFICSQCGLILGTNYISVVTERNDEGSTWQKFKTDAPKSIPYRHFHHLYYVTSISVNSPKEVIEQGFTLLPKVWKKFKQYQSHSKEKAILAFIYLLQIQNNITIPLKAFLCKQKLDPHRVLRYVKILQVLLDFKSAICIQSNEEFQGTILSIVEIMFYNANPKLLKDTETLANELATLIHERKWINDTTKNYISVVSTCAAVISGRSVVMNYTDKGRHGKRKTFFRDYLNIQKVFQASGVHVRSMQNFLKCVMEELFIIANKMPWKPNFLKKYSDVPYAVEEIIRFCEIEEETFQYTNYHSSKSQDITIVRNILTKALVSYFDAHSESNSQNFTSFNLTLFCRYFKDNFLDELVYACDRMRMLSEDNEINIIENEEEIDSKEKLHNKLFLHSKSDDVNTINIKTETGTGNSCEKNELQISKTSQKKENSGNNIIRIKKNCFAVNDDIEISFYHILLVKDLLKAGCSPDEIKNESYIDLVKKYLDPIANNELKTNIKVEENSFSENDDEIDGYLCTPEEIANKTIILENLS